MVRLVPRHCVRPSLYEFAGGTPALIELARAHHARCVADPELNHPFSHDDLNPQHVERLGWSWAEVMGGPPTYSERCGTESTLLQMHSGNGDMSDLGERFLGCFVSAMDDAALPDDAEFRQALGSSMRWTVDQMLAVSPAGATVPGGLSVPRWSWDGLVGSGVTGT